MVQRLGPLQMERKLLEKPCGVHACLVVLKGLLSVTTSSVVHGAKPR